MLSVQRVEHCLSSSVTLHFPVLREDLTLNQKLTASARLARGVLGTGFFPPFPQAGGHRSVHMCLTLYMGADDSNGGFTLVQQVLVCRVNCVSVGKIQYKPTRRGASNHLT